MASGMGTWINGYCGHVACEAAHFGSLSVAAMPPGMAGRILDRLRESHRGESWVAVVLASHVRHVS